MTQNTVYVIKDTRCNTSLFAFRTLAKAIEARDRLNQGVDCPCYAVEFMWVED